jgi:hypothetical protein
MFLNHLYGGMDEPELKIIDVFTCKLRNTNGSAAIWLVRKFRFSVWRRERYRRLWVAEYP